MDWNVDETAIDALHGMRVGGLRLCVQRVSRRKAFGSVSSKRGFGPLSVVARSEQVNEVPSVQATSVCGRKSFAQVVKAPSQVCASGLPPFGPKMVQGYSGNESWLCRSAIAVLWDGELLGNVRSEILARRSDVFRVNAVDVRSVLVTFQSIDMCDATLLGMVEANSTVKSRSSSWFQSMELWDVSYKFWHIDGVACSVQVANDSVNISSRVVLGSCSKELSLQNLGLIASDGDDGVVAVEVSSSQCCEVCCCKEKVPGCLHDVLSVPYPISQDVMSKGGLACCNKGTQVDLDDDGMVVFSNSGDVVSDSCVVDSASMELVKDSCISCEKDLVVGCPCVPLVHDSVIKEGLLEPDPQTVAICSCRVDASGIASHVTPSFNPDNEHYCGDPGLLLKQSVASEGVVHSSIVGKVSHAVVVDGGVFELARVPSVGVAGSSSTEVPPSSAVYEASSSPVLHEVPVAGESNPSFSKADVKIYARMYARIVSTAIKVCK